MVTSVFRPEVKLWPFCACAVKNTQYNPYLWPNRRNFYVVQEIGVEELDGVIRCYTGNGNMAVSRMRNEKCAITLICTRIAEISTSHRKLGSRNSMLTSDFTPEMEMWPFRICTMKNMQYN